MKPTGWPHQLYVREARRMKSAYIVTQKDLEGATNPDDSVGLGSYGLDDWPYATIAHEGGVALSGGEFSIMKVKPEPQRHPQDPVLRDHTQEERMSEPARAGVLLGEPRCDDFHPHGARVGHSRAIGWYRCGATAIAQNAAVQAIDARDRQALLDAGQVLKSEGISNVGWNSREEWNRDKPGWEWLFPVIDKDKDGKISGDGIQGVSGLQKETPGLPGATTSGSGSQVKDDQRKNLLLYPTLSETGMRLGIDVRNSISWFAHSLIAGGSGPDDSRYSRDQLFLKHPVVVGQAMAHFLSAWRSARTDGLEPRPRRGNGCGSSSNGRNMGATNRNFLLARKNWGSTDMPRKEETPYRPVGSGEDLP